MEKNVLSVGSIDQKFNDIIETPEWKILEKEFSRRKNTILFGNGGNMSIADHGAIDICRLTDKNAICPGSGITCSSIIGDQGFEPWLKTWVDYRLRSFDPDDTLAIGFSCSSSGPSSNSIVNALELSQSIGVFSCLISATKKENVSNSILVISQDTTHYHISEIISTALFYQLIHSAGFKCPIIKGK